MAAHQRVTVQGEAGALEGVEIIPKEASLEELAVAAGWQRDEIQHREGMIGLPRNIENLERLEAIQPVEENDFHYWWFRR
jgi:hypothetical protein